MTTLFKDREKAVFFSTLSVLFLFFFLLDVFSEATYDAGDGIRHYLVSRYSWKHPELLLYSWGKPFFTLLASPFCQFGLIGANLFNILCGAFSCILCYRIAGHLGSPNKMLFPFLLFFLPSYFAVMNSGLTEPLFGLVLCGSVLLAIEKKFLWSAVLVSFLPYVRSEGYLILPLFGLIYLYRRHWLSIPFLGTGTAVLSVAGYFYYKNILWLIAENPYTGSNADLYKSGELLHFVHNYEFIFGIPLLLPVLAGILYGILSIFRKPSHSFRAEMLLLVFGSGLLYFAAHSVFWWKGICGSLGLLRVMAGIGPVFALIALRGLDFIAELLPPKPTVRRIALGIYLPFILWYPFTQEFFPYVLYGEQKHIAKVSEWFNTYKYKDRKLYFLHPYLFYTLGVDPYDRSRADELWSLYPNMREWGVGVVPDTSIVIWDAHYGPNECRIPLDMLKNDTNFRLVKEFVNEDNWMVLGGYRFDVNIFMKVPNPVRALNINDFDLESDAGLENTYTLSTETARSGKRSSKLSAKCEYGVLMRKHTPEIPDHEHVIRIEAEAWVKAPKGLEEAKFVMSTDDPSGKQVAWDGVPFNNLPADTAWKYVKAVFKADPAMMNSDRFIKFYIWNNKFAEFYVDDIHLKFLGRKDAAE